MLKVTRKQANSVKFGYHFGVYKRIGDEAGKVISLHHSWDAADKAIGNRRIDLAISDLRYGLRKDRWDFESVLVTDAT